MSGAALAFLSGRRGRRPRRRPPGREVGDRARAARPRRHVRGARRLARSRLDPRRGRSRRRRHRRRLAPDEARGAPRRRARSRVSGIVWYPISPRRALVLCAPALGDVGARADRRPLLARRHGRLLGDRDRRPRGRHGPAPDDPHPPLPLGRRDRARPGPRAAARRRLLGDLRRRSSATTSGRSRSTAPPPSAAARSASTPSREARHEGHLLPQGDPEAARAAEEALRRRHRRRRLARPRDRVLPRDPPRHHRRRDPREELHRLGRGRAQHDDHPLELPHARGRRVLHGERQALREALRRSRLQHDVLAARALHAGPLRPVARRAERARRGEQAPRHRQPRDRPAGGEEALPADPHRRGRDLADPGRALPPAGRDHPARRRRLGLRQAGRPPRRRDPPGRRGDGLRRQGRQGARRQDEPGRHLVRRRAQRHRRLVDARSPPWRACRCRSPGRSCRRS